MMDDLATDLLRQQDEELFAIGYYNTDGARIDDNLYMRSEPSYRARVDRAHALKDVAENMLWYSAICDAATTSGFGMPPAVRSSTCDKVDIDAMQLTAALPSASISAPRTAAMSVAGYPPHSTSMDSVPGVSAPYGQSEIVGSLHNISPNPNELAFGDPSMLRLETGFVMPPPMQNDFGAIPRDWQQRADLSAHSAQNVSMPSYSSHALAGAGSAPLSPASVTPQTWIRVAERALQVSRTSRTFCLDLPLRPVTPLELKNSSTCVRLERQHRS